MTVVCNTPKYFKLHEASQVLCNILKFQTDHYFSTFPQHIMKFQGLFNDQHNLPGLHDLKIWHRSFKIRLHKHYSAKISKRLNKLSWCSCNKAITLYTDTDNHRLADLAILWDHEKEHQHRLNKTSSALHLTSHTTTTSNQHIQKTNKQVVKDWMIPSAAYCC